MPVTYGSSGVLAKDYKVWIFLAGVTACENLITEYLAANNYSNDISFFSRYQILKSRTASPYHLLRTLPETNAYFLEVGECRKDSIDNMIENGDTINGNNAGEIVLNVSGTFTAELMNATVDNIVALQNTYGGKLCHIILTEINTHYGINEIGDPWTSKDSFSTAILIRNVTPKISEKHVGGGVSIITLSVSKNVPTADDFREIYDVDSTAPVNIMLEAPVAITADPINATDFTAKWNAADAADGYRLDVSKYADFSICLTGYANKTVAGTSQSVTGLTTATTYYYRVRAVDSTPAVLGSLHSNTITVLTD